MIKGKIRRIVLDILLKLNQKKNNYQILLDINKNAEGNQKRVLLCYLDYVSSNIRLYKNATHTNFAELDMIIKALIDKNVVLDICSFEAEGIDDIIENRSYDYIIGFGNIFRKAVSYHLGAKKILYVTENPYHISRKAEQDRIDYFKERTGRKTRLFRTGRSYLDEDLKLADAIICLGEKRHLQHLGIPVIHVTPTGLCNETYKFLWDNKAKNKFLVFGSNGIIHKGIDLLIQVFKEHPEWELYICGAGTDKALKKYHINEITENIHLCGYVSTQSTEFISLVNMCTFVLLPSCSEACATSLLTCMRHGMIPITTQNNGMEQYAEYCYFFEDYHLESIENKIKDMLQYDMESLKEKASAIYTYSDKQFCLNRFYRDIEKALEQIL